MATVQLSVHNCTGVRARFAKHGAQEAPVIWVDFTFETPDGDAFEICAFIRDETMALQFANAIHRANEVIEDLKVEVINTEASVPCV